MVGVALPSIGSELNLSTSTLQWVLSGYILGYGGLLLLAGRRTQAERDATTVEIGFALFAATSLACATMLAVASPAFLFGVTSPSQGTLVLAGKIVGTVVFVAVLVTILVRHRHATRQPSQPGRTRPDS